MVPLIRRNRILEREEDVLTQNAWDDIEWTSDMLEEAHKRLQQQKDESEGLRVVIGNVEQKVVKKWDKFYQAHGDKFFKDRRWLFSEFPEIISYLNSDSQPCRIFEVGCGVGNAVSHILDTNKNSNLHIYCCDLAPNAIEILEKRDIYIKNKDKVTAFPANVCDDVENALSQRIQKESINFITLIFSLSAMKPDLIEHTVQKLATFLRPGGMILFRDYARYDLTQLRFKGKSYLSENYYVRADGTTSYFFTEERVDKIFTSAGLNRVQLKQDNRLLVNRSKSIKMCRCWVQAKYSKASSSDGLSR